MVVRVRPKFFSTNVLGTMLECPAGRTTLVPPNVLLAMKFSGPQGLFDPFLRAKRDGITAAATGLNVGTQPVMIARELSIWPNAGAQLFV